MSSEFKSREVAQTQIYVITCSLLLKSHTHNFSDPSEGLWSVWFLTLVVYVWNWYSDVEIMIRTWINVNQMFRSIFW